MGMLFKFQKRAGEASLPSPTPSPLVGRLPKALYLSESSPESLLSVVYHCLESVQIRRFLWSLFSLIRTEFRDACVDLPLFSLNMGKYRPEKPPYLYTFPQRSFLHIPYHSQKCSFWVASSQICHELQTWN